MGDAIYEVRGLRKAFGAKAVLDGVDLTLRRGETLALLGPSGCGKSVLLKCLVGLVPFDAGEVRFEGESVAAMDDAALIRMRQRVGLMFQYNALFDSMTVGENTAYGLHERLGGKMPEREVAARVDEALAAVGMAGTQDLRPDELSGGMRKRVGLARTMALRPEVILYDEPTMGLDPVNTHRIDDIIRDLHARYGISAIMVTHDMKLAFHVSDRVAMMLDGRVVALDTPDGIRAHPDERVRDFISGTDHAVLPDV
ncbi:MAG: ATP-binding cassette domain-containing protein [Polyangiales bacterium]